MPQKILYIFLLTLSFAVSFSFYGWVTLINNYSFSVFNFTGSDIGFLQSIREVPGLLAFTIFIPLLFLKEISLCILSLLLLGIGIILTSYFNTVWGLYLGTVIMSIGFHYCVTLKNSLVLQNSDPSKASFVLGKVVAFGSIGSFSAFLIIYLLNQIFALQEKYLFYFIGLTVLVLFIFVAILSKKIVVKDGIQRKELFLKKEYLLFYLLNLFAGARRQIFMVFGSFLMIEKFHYTLADISLLFLFNQIFNYFVAPYIGKFIHIIGEKQMLTIEYCGLFIIFLLYAHVDNFYIAGLLYIIDNLFFLMAIAIHSYFKKIAKHEDISSSMSISFTINHIMAVFIPALYGLIWVNFSYQFVFYSAACFALCSLVLAQFIKLPRP